MCITAANNKTIHKYFNFCSSSQEARFNGLENDCSAVNKITKKKVGWGRGALVISKGKAITANKKTIHINDSHEHANAEISGNYYIHL